MADCHASGCSNPAAVRVRFGNNHSYKDRWTPALDYCDRHGQKVALTFSDWGLRVLVEDIEPTDRSDPTTKRECARCGHDPACGFASIWTEATGQLWYCHDDDHSCYGTERRPVRHVADCGQCCACATHHAPQPTGDLTVDIATMARFIVCPTCGNKRCPHATDHRLDCTGSNEPNQPGSAYQQRYFEGDR